MDEILSHTPLIDGHNDFPHSVRKYLDRDVSRLQMEDLTNIEPWASQPDSHTDIKRLREAFQ